MQRHLFWPPAFGGDLPAVSAFPLFPMRKHKKTEKGGSKKVAE